MKLGTNVMSHHVNQNFEKNLDDEEWDKEDGVL